jgi:glutathione S-transferase
MSNSSVVFTYFDGRGHGERVRYALAGAGVEWTERTLRENGDVDEVRPLCLFDQVPLLEMGGERVVQSWAIVRHIAATCGPAAATPGAAWQADAAAEQVRDYFTAANLVGFGWSEDRESDMAKVRSATARYFPLFERHLKASGGYVTGTSACWADFQLLYGFDYAAELLGEEALTEYPCCQSMRTSLRGLPRMQSFYAQRAKRLVDQKYISEVRAAQLPKSR